MLRPYGRTGDPSGALASRAMRIRGVGKSAAGLVAVVALVVVGVPAGYLLIDYGCGGAEQRLGEALAADPVLDDGPDGAEPQESYQECDDDDLFVVAGTAYRFGGSRGQGLSHYRDAAEAHGWRYRTSDCFTKSIDGTLAQLTVVGPADGSLHVEIIAQRDSSEPEC